MSRVVFKYSDFFQDDGGFDNALKKIEQIGDKIVDSAKETKQKFNKEFSLDDSGGISKLEKQVEELTLAYKKQGDMLKKLRTTRKGTPKAITKETEAIKKNNAERRLQAKIQNTQTGSIENLRIKLSLVTVAWSKLTKAELENSKRGQRLVESKKALTAELLRLEQKTGDNRRQVGAYHRGLGKLRGSLINVANAAGVTVGLFGAFRVLRDSTEIVRSFEKQNATLSGVLRKTKEEITPLTDEAKRLGSVTVKTAGEVAQLQTEYARLGFSQNEIIALTESTIEGSIAMNSELAATAKLVGGVVNSYDNLSATDAPEIIDALTLATTKSALDFEKLNTALPITLGAANALGVPLNEVTATLGKLADANIDASSGATALRNIFIESAKRGIDYKEALALIEKSTDKLTTANNIFGKRAAVSALIVAKNAKGVAELTEELDNAAGAAKELAEKELATLDGSLKLLRSAWEGFVLEMNDATNGGNALSDSIRFVADNLKTILKVLGVATSSWLAYNIVMKAANVTSRIGAAITTLTTKAKIAQTSATVAGTAAQRAFNVATKANPLGILIALLAAAVTAYYAFRDSATEAEKAQKLFNAAREAGRESVEKVIKEEKEATNERIRLLKQELTVRRAAGEDSKKLDKEFIQGKKTILSEDVKANKKIIASNIRRVAALQEVEAERLKQLKKNLEAGSNLSIRDRQIVQSTAKAKVLAIKKEISDKQALLVEDTEQRQGTINSYVKQLKRLEEETKVTETEITEAQKKAALDRAKELALLRRRLEDLQDDSIKSQEARERQKAKRKFDREIQAIKGNSKVEIALRDELEKTKQRRLTEISKKYTDERKVVLERAADLERQIIGDSAQKEIAAERKKADDLIKEISNNAAFTLERKIELQEIERKRLNEAVERINTEASLKELENDRLLERARVEQQRKSFKTEKEYIEFKQKSFNKIERDYLNKRIELLSSFSGDQFKVEIEQLKARLANLGDPPQVDKWKEFAQELKDVFSLVGKSIISSMEASLKKTQDSLNKQRTLVDTQTRRAERGLTNTLAFEQKELAKREGEVIKRQKRLERVRKLQGYWNTYNANVNSLEKGEDSSKAITKTLKDIAVIEAITASFGDGGIVGIDGYTDANGITKGGSHASGTDVLAKFESGEGFLSRKEVSNMGVDNFRTIKRMAGDGEIGTDFFEKQRKVFVQEVSAPPVKVDNRLLTEMQEVKRAIQNKPVQTWELAESTSDTIKLIEKVSSKGKTRRNTHIIKKPRI
ncbi:MAG: phage tail tape measure protein [Flavobacteriaceae bacterium]